MSFIEIHYDDTRTDWREALDRQVERALKQLNYKPDTVICWPLESGSQLRLFNKTDGVKTDGYQTNSLELYG